MGIKWNPNLGRELEKQLIGVVKDAEKRVNRRLANRPRLNSVMNPQAPDDISDVGLEAEQKALFDVLAEASRNVSRENRTRFVFEEFNGGSILRHPGLPSGGMDDVYSNDLRELAQQGLLNADFSEHGMVFDISAKGFRFYRESKASGVNVADRVEATVSGYLASHVSRFQTKYPQSWSKLIEAERQLRNIDALNFSSVALLCIEAMQEFAEVIFLESSDLPRLTENLDKKHTKNRVRHALQRVTSVSTKDILDSLIGLWESVSDSAQKIKHSGEQASGATFDQTRRIVFLTNYVLFEIDKALSVAGGNSD